MTIDLDGLIIAANDVICKSTKLFIEEYELTYKHEIINNVCTVEFNDHGMSDLKRQLVTLIDQIRTEFISLPSLQKSKYFENYFIKQFALYEDGKTIKYFTFPKSDEKFYDNLRDGLGAIAFINGLAAFCCFYISIDLGFDATLAQYGLYALAATSIFGAVSYMVSLKIDNERKKEENLNKNLNKILTEIDYHQVPLSALDQEEKELLFTHKPTVSKFLTTEQLSQIDEFAPVSKLDGPNIPVRFELAQERV